jgi:hypothetical protein
MEKQNLKDLIIKRGYLILFLLLLVYFSRYFFHLFYWIAFPLPIEYQEPNLIGTVDAIRNGFNPYNDMAPHNYRYWYGPIYPYLINFLDNALFIKNVAITARSFSVLVVLGIAVIIYRCSHFLKYRLFNFVLIYSILLPLSYNDLEVSSRPDALGLFFVVVSVAITFITNKQSIFRLWLSSLFLVLAFFTKQYFILCFALPIWKLSDWKHRLFYFIFLGVNFLALAFWFYWFLPLSWSMFFFSFLGFTVTQWTVLINELGLFVEGFWVLIVLGLLQVYTIVKFKSVIIKKQEKLSQFRFFFYVLITMILIVIYIGRNDGYTRTYLLQFFLPILTLIIFSKPIFKKESQNLFVVILLTGWMNLSLHKGRNHFQNTSSLTFSEQQRNFQTLDSIQILTRKDNKRTVVFSPLIAQVVLQNKDFGVKKEAVINFGGLGGGLKIPLSNDLNFIPINSIKNAVSLRNKTLFDYDSIYLDKLNNECQKNSNQVIVIGDNFNDLPNQYKGYFDKQINLPIFIGRKKSYQIRIYSN